MNTTTETAPTPSVLEIPLSVNNQLALEKLASWSKVVAVINIIFGILNCLTIFVFSIPTMVMGIFMILMGTRLNSAAAHISYSLYHKHSESLATALDKLRAYMLYNGILLILLAVLVIMLLIFVLTLGSAFFEMFEEYLLTAVQQRL